MKKLLYTLTIITIIFSSCKKGEDDRIISLKSRDARLKGTWKLVNMETVYESNNVYTGGSTYQNKSTKNFDGTVLKETSSITSGGNTSYDETTSNYNLEISFEKNGVYKNKETKLLLTSNNTPVQNSTEIITEGEAEWFWIDNDKKKTYLITSDFSGNVSRLTNKELEIRSFSKSNTTQNSNAYNSNYLSEEVYKFEKVK